MEIVLHAVAEGHDGENDMPDSYQNDAVRDGNPVRCTQEHVTYGQLRGCVQSICVGIVLASLVV